MVPTKYYNWMKHKLGMRRHIIGLRFTTTWKCNSKCITCAIWKDKNAGENDLTVTEIDRFSRSKYFTSASYITLSGGEPTLRSDLPEIVSVLHKNIPHATFGITTNGMDPYTEEQIFTKILKRNPDIIFHLVGISLNGPREIHDKTRGITGAWDKAIETYERIKDIVHCEFSFTFCKDNVNHFEWVRNFARKRGTKAYICWTVMNDRFDVSDRDLVFWKPGMEDLLEKYCLEENPFPNNIFGKLTGALFLPRNLTLACLYDHIINMKNMPCFAGTQIVHIDPDGNVFPCNFKLSQDRIIGNIRTNTFEDIWDNISPKTLKEIQNCECMYPNGLCGDSDIYPSVVNSPLFVIKWYLLKLLKNRPLVDIWPSE